MSKYEPLGKYLETKNEQTIRMSFEEIENVLGFELAKSFHKYRVAWLGSAEASPRHVAKAVWQSAGYTVSMVDLVSQYVIFEKI